MLISTGVAIQYRRAACFDLSQEVRGKLTTLFLPWGDRSVATLSAKPLICSEEIRELIQVGSYSVGRYLSFCKHLHCPVCAIACYVERTTAITRMEQ